MNIVVALSGAFLISGIMLCACLLIALAIPAWKPPKMSVLLNMWTWGAVAIVASAAVAVRL